MKWYFPSWNGDVRAEADGDSTRITVVAPTANELAVLEKLDALLHRNKWLPKVRKLWDRDEKSAYRTGQSQTTLIEQPLSKVGPLLVELLKPGEQTLTAVQFKDGRVETVSGASAVDALAAKAEQEAATAAASVKRPTPSCPNCYVDACGPATEVLLDFLSPDQHEDWARERAFVVEGGYTGARYLLAHRSSRHAARHGRICYDLDAETVVRFHDQRVPPEEEVLAAKLILEHREDWLRNEATLLNAPPGTLRFKNPFGDAGDGIADADFTGRLGLAFGQVTEGLTGVNPIKPRHRRHSYRTYE